MHRKCLLSVAAALVLTGAFTACSLSKSGIAPDPVGTGGGGSGGGGGSAAEENCFNDKDDNGDGALDCLDPACSSAVTCEEVPERWTAVVTERADPSMPLGQCRSGADGKLFFIGPAGAPECSACDCAADTATKCGAPRIVCFLDRNDCSGTDFQLQATTNDCTEIPGVAGGANVDGSCQLTSLAQIVSGGNCNLVGGKVTSPKWSDALLACPIAPITGGCASGQLCLPQGEGLDRSLCITRPGRDACPPSFPRGIDAFLGGNDTQSCTACDCKVGCSGGSYLVHDLDACGTDSMNPDVLITSMDCTQTPTMFDDGTASLRPSLATVSSACTGGVPQGRVEGTGPQRICCKE